MDYETHDRREEERLVAALRREGFFRPRRRASTWALYAAAAALIFFVGVATGMRLAGRPAAVETGTVITTQGTLWF